MKNEPTSLLALKNNFQLESLTLRRALRSAIVVFISILLYREYSIMQGYWVTLTAFIVVQATVGATLRKGVQRFIGTLLGVSIASLLLLAIHNIYVIDVLVILLLFTTYFFNPFSNLINYGFVVIPLSIMVVFTIALVTPDRMNIDIVYARFYDTTIGAIIGILGSFFLFPNKVKHQFNTSKQNVRKQLAEYYLAIMNMMLDVQGATKQAYTKKRLVEEALLADRQFYLERVYEIHFKKDRRQQRQNEKRFLAITEKMAQRLFSLHHLARYHLAPELIQAQEDMLQQLRNTMADLLLQPQGSPEKLLALLADMQKQLAAYGKNLDNPVETWRYLAPLANLNFIIQDLLDDITELKSLPSDEKDDDVSKYSV